VVSNAILLIDFVERNRADLPLEEALVMAGSVRVRPILMTAVATIAALVPSRPAYSTSGGGGLISQSLRWSSRAAWSARRSLTLLVIPIVYSMLRRRGRRAIQLADRLGRRLMGNPANHHSYHQGPVATVWTEELPHDLSR